MEKFNIVVAKEYEKDGETKKAWRTVGELIRWPAKGDKPEQFSIELHMFPNQKFYVFEQKSRDERRGSDDIT